MADYTENYQLEKPLPEEFYDVGVQNGNLDKIDTAIAAIDAAKAGEKGDLADDDALPLMDSADSSKTKRVLWSTVKTALANLFVPLTRKVNGKALSEDLTLTGEDIKVSGSDETSISSSLSNKMDVTAIGGYCPDAYTADSGLLFLAPDGVGVDKTENAPLDATWGLIQKMGVGSIYTMMALDSDARAWINGYNGLVWAGWQKIATATPPQKYTLPLADGWVRVNAAEYWKTQEGIVIVPFRVARENGAEINTSTQIIATLPEGFRPPSDVTPHIAVSTMVVGSGGDRDAVAWVNSSGNIYAQASSSIPAKDGGTPVNWGGFAGTFVFSSGS